MEVKDANRCVTGVFDTTRAVTKGFMPIGQLFLHAGPRGCSATKIVSAWEEAMERIWIME